MNRETFFSEAQKLLVNAKSWIQFVKEANVIKVEQEEFPYLHLFTLIMKV